ncbi:MAG: SufD family Fe-S cluster assembly protein, partial [Mucinivorans sp.]
MAMNNNNFMTVEGFTLELTDNEQACGVITIDLKEQSSSYGFITLGPGSHGRVVVNYPKASSAVTMDVRVERNAVLELVVVADSGADVKSTVRTVLQRDSQFTMTTIDLKNSSLERHHTVLLEQTGAQCTLSGLFVAGAEQSVENYIKVVHNAAGCTSNQNFKGIAAATGRGLFAGHIYVAKDAQQTMAMQQNHNILLSDLARIQSRPWLEIYADDVKCNHGATVGR